MEKINNQDRIITKIIKEEKIRDSSIELSDDVVFYFNGFKFVVIPLNLMKCYPIIYDTIDVEYNGSKYNYDVSIIHCPKSGFTFILHGRYILEDYMEDDRIIVSNIENTFKDNIFDIYKKNSCIRRWEVRIDKFKNILINHPDFLLVANKQDNFPLFKLTSLYKNSKSLIHPLTVVYLLEYKSEKENKDKYTVIVGNDHSKKKPIFNFKYNGINEYLRKNSHDLQLKCAFIIPIYWHTVNKYYNKAKVIILD